MLIELWERLRGYDKWIETEARIESSQMRETPYTNRDGSVSYTYDASDMLTWLDAQGEKQYAAFTVDDLSPVYQLVGGESVTIRYNPQDPSQFYYRDLLRSRVKLYARTSLGIAALVAVALAAAFLRTR